MKHTFLFSLQALLTMGALMTQSLAFGQNSTKKIEIGVEGGVNYSLGSPNPTFGKQIAMPGYQAGLGAKLKISESCFITSQATYIRQLAKYSNSTLEATNSYSWIGLPTYFNYTAGSGGNKAFILGLGLSPQRLLASKINFTWNVSGVEYTGSPDNLQAMTWNLFAMVQTGLRFSLNQGGAVSLLLSYKTNIFELEKNYPTSANGSTLLTSLNRISSLTLSTSYYF